MPERYERGTLKVLGRTESESMFDCLLASNLEIPAKKLSRKN
jgi:hypothetical protein